MPLSVAASAFFLLQCGGVAGSENGVQAAAAASAGRPTFENTPRAKRAPDPPRGAIQGRVLLPPGLELSDAERTASELALYSDPRRPGLGPDLGFEFDAVEPGDRCLRLRVPGFQPIEHRLLVNGGQLSRVELVLELGGTLEGLVRNDAGQPVGRAGVNVFVQPRERSSISMYTTTDDRGEFRLAGVPAGDVRLSASSDGLCPAHVALGEIVGRDRRAGLELVLARGNELGGRAWCADGTPAAGAKIEIWSEAPGASELHVLLSRADGTFHQTGLGTGPFRVSCWTGRPKQLEVAGARRVHSSTGDLELRLAPPGRIEVTGADPACIQIRDLAGLEPGPQRDAFHPPAWPVADLAPGEYWVLTKDRTESMAAVTRVRVEGAFTSQAVIAMRPASRLSIRVPWDLQPFIVRAESGFAWRLDAGMFLQKGGFTETAVVLPPGTYRIERELGGHPAIDVVLSGEPEREVVLK